MGKITDYNAEKRLTANDVLLIDGSGGTRKIAAPDAAVEMAGLVSAVFHRSVYRGKNLGTSVTAAQKTAISSGTFDDLYVGDYWVIGGVNWRIADFNYFSNCGDTAFTKNHLVIVPDTVLYDAKMNETNVTTGGYTGSLMKTENLAQAKEQIVAAFGDMLLTHREYLTNAVTNGYPSAGAWFDSDVELMNEIMVYGCPIYLPGGNGSTTPNRYTVAKQQLALFALNPGMANIRADYWLRDVVSAAHFADVRYNGAALSFNASYSSGVRPEFCIG